MEAQQETIEPPTKTQPSRADALVLLLLLVLALPWISAFFEWKHFRQELNLLDIRPWTWRDLPLVWLEYAKTQLVLLPALLLASLLIFFRWWKTALLLFVLCVAAVFIWIEADEQVFTMTNVHVFGYLEFVGDPTATQWAGGNAWASSLDLASGLKSVALLSLIAIAVACAFAAAARRLLTSRARTRLAASLAAAYVLLLIVLAPAQRLFQDRHDLQRIHALLPFDMTWTAVGMHLVDTSSFAKPLNDRLTPALRQHLPTLIKTQTLDKSAGSPSGPRPHVVLIIVESLREDAMAPDVMPRLCELSHRGMRLSQHYAGCRMSHLGCFNLLFGKTSATYYMTLLSGATVTPQACITLKNCGYRTTYTASADHRDWVRMGQFISEKTFDSMDLFHAKSWITRDGRTLGRVKEVLTTAGANEPQFVTAFVASTHYPYIYPPEFGTRKPALPEKFRFMALRRDLDMPLLRNRYMNSCAFMDSQIADLISQLDLSKTLVIVTGDHGESLLDDGAMAHGGRWSDSQLRVPCFFVGAGVAPRIVTEPTTHVDVLPTLLHVVAGRKVPLQAITGRDVLAGDPPPAFHVLGANSLGNKFEMLIDHAGRRMLFAFPLSRYQAFVRGSVDVMGEVDPFNIPPPQDAAEWGDGIANIFATLTATTRK